MARFMLKLSTTFAVLAFVTIAAFSNANAEESTAKRISFLDGIFSVEVPEGWNTELASNEQMLTITQENDSQNRVCFITPNPNVKGKIEIYSKAHMKAFLAKMDSGEIVEEIDNKFKDYPAHAIIFAAKNKDAETVGLLGGLDFDGFGVIVMCYGPKESFQGFIGKGGMVIDSYEIDLDKARANLEKLTTIGNAIESELGEWDIAQE